MIIKPDWNIFKAKFSGKESKEFEWLCYLLFCRKFNRPEGILRYINQAGIETNPIDVNGQKIGFQAKFFDSRLSEHKKDFIQSIDITIKKHPKIQTIIFYINQDFSEGKKGLDPQYKIDIEKHAKSKKISIEWKPASFFESDFVCIKNKDIAQYFFSQTESVFSLIRELSEHTKSILKPIQSEIIYNKKSIKIDRSDILNQLKESLTKSSITILSGEAGSGKTAVIKNLYEIHQKNTAPFFVFKAVEFNNLNHINRLFKNYGDFTLSDFRESHKECQNKYIVIDSTEKLFDIKR